ncbi:acylneuraminate cytidylyltransferase family protein [Flavobacterium sp. MC2016-06]|jgi:CMP-N,N'-diacetyllegionaminic acid synthase|uniref:acylneuraminate cytidylyltransferase family protein n=1 Tax=Flavobacterium sp. MC2016-06 TaxID=2676308 RepID=UPI0012BB12A5|nr:acylneuraminate cytidylyltransferase family protein [Flavobacterium sp. MC2016-06]MBU3858634.1 acylneuraminate cytidylyltransferase family protein [Flavobacterium sp. MC2016-06]
MRILYLIPARSGSKGLPGKNVKLLGNKPLVTYSIDFALQNMKEDDELCISTNDQDVIKIANDLGIDLPFVRPDELAADASSSYDVIMHALKHYEENRKNFDFVLLLQPTSPFRNNEDIENLFLNYSDDTEMVVTVKNSKENPYFTLFEENEFGFLDKSKIGDFQRRQDCPEVFAFNGSMYLFKVSALLEKKISEFKKIKKVVMPEERSIDIDTIADWTLAEFYLDKQ